MKNLSASDFQELIKVINCFSGADYEECFGRDFEHYIAKRQRLGLGEFICYLDSGNIKQVFEHANNKMESFRAEQSA